MKPSSVAADFERRNRQRLAALKAFLGQVNYVPTSELPGRTPEIGEARPIELTKPSRPLTRVRRVVERLGSPSYR